MFPRNQALHVEQAAARRHWNTWYQKLDALQKAEVGAALATRAQQIAAQVADLGGLSSFHRRIGKLHGRDHPFAFELTRTHRSHDRPTPTLSNRR